MGALVTVPIILSCGVVSYQSIGPAYVAAGIAASFVSAIVAALVAGVFGGPPLHVNTPKTSHAAILSGLIAVIATHYSFSEYFSGATAVTTLMTICFITLFIAGLCQAALGALRLGGLVKFVPYPVLAGIINGFALQIIIGQIPNALGVEGTRQVAQVLAGWHPFNGWALTFALLAGGLVLVGGRLSKKMPAALIGLALGTLAFIVAGQYVEASTLGPVIGQLPTGIALEFRVEDMRYFMASVSFKHHLFPIVATGVTLALISSIQSLLSMAGSDELFNTRHDSNKELMVQGGTNMLAALLGGSPSGGSPNVTRTVYANGGRRRQANLALGLTLAVMAYGLGDLIARIPLSVMAGVVIASTASTMDRWTQQLLRKVGTSSSAARRSDALVNLAVVLIVTALVIFEGVLAALGVGIALVFFIFLYRANSTVIGRVRHADQITSRTERPWAATRALAEHAHRIAVLELNGPLFFGNTEAVYQRLEKEAVQAQWLILSFKRCPVIDTSGAMLLKQLAAFLRQGGKRLLLADLPPGGQRREYLHNVGVEQLEKDGMIFADLDAALASAENELLHGLGLSGRSEAQADFFHFDVLATLSVSERTTLHALLERRQFEAGEGIIQEGAADHSLYFLISGKVSVYTHVAERPLLLASYSAGVDAMFGEMAVLTQEMRSADVHADTAVTVLQLTHEAFERLCRDHPGIAIGLMRGVSQELSMRLTRMIRMVRELET